MSITVHRSTAASPCAMFALAMTQALAKIRTRTVPTAALSEMSDLLKALPLSKPEVGLAESRLHHAARYLRSGEWGAASWELQTLMAGLDHMLVTVEARPASFSVASRWSPAERKCTSTGFPTLPFVR